MRIPLTALRLAVLIRLLCLAGLLFALIVGEPPEETRFWNSLFDTGHALVFGLVMWLNAGIAESVLCISRKNQNLVRAFAVTLAIAALSELAQVLDYRRQPSVVDFLRDAAGASIWTLTRIAGHQKPSSAWTGMLRLGAIAIAIGVVVPLLTTVELYRQRDRRFPVLVSFDQSRWEREFLRVRRATLTPGARLHADRADSLSLLALLDLRPGRYPGFAVDEPYPDWRGFQRLVLPIISEQQLPLEITLRIHDRWHNGEYDDRFNRTIAIHPGTQQVEIELREVRAGRRSLDLSRVRSVALFAYQLQRPARIYVGALRLE